MDQWGQSHSAINDSVPIDFIIDFHSENQTISRQSMDSEIKQTAPKKSPQKTQKNQ